MKSDDDDKMSESEIRLCWVVHANNFNESDEHLYSQKQAQYWWTFYWKERTYVAGTH